MQLINRNGSQLSATAPEYHPLNRIPFQEELIFSPRYNLLLDVKVNGNTYTFKVLSAALQNASTKWERQLDPSSSSSAVVERRLDAGIAKKGVDGVLSPGSGRPLPVLVLEAPAGTDVDALIIFFNVIHLQSHKIPDQVTLRQLRCIAALAKTYKCLDAFSKHALDWFMSPIQDTSRRAETAQEKEDLIYIGYVFKHKEFGQALKGSIESTILRITGMELDKGEIYLEDPDDESTRQTMSTNRLPNSITYDILETRRTAMETSLRQLSSAVRLVISRGADQVTPKPLTIPCDKKICWDLVVGSFLREIDEKGLEFLIKSDGQLPDDISINTMLEKIRTLAITVPKTSANMPGDIHYGSKPEVCPGFVTSGENIKGVPVCPLLRFFDDLKLDAASTVLQHIATQVEELVERALS